MWACCEVSPLSWLNFRLIFCFEGGKKEKERRKSMKRLLRINGWCCVVSHCSGWTRLRGNLSLLLWRRLKKVRNWNIRRMAFLVFHLKLWISEFNFCCYHPWAELMLFGLLSLLMGHWIKFVAKICIKSSALSSQFYPCAREGDFRTGDHILFLNSVYPNISKEQVIAGEHHFCPEVRFLLVQLQLPMLVVLGG